jgi:hypothetical protein
MKDLEQKLQESQVAPIKLLFSAVLATTHCYLHTVLTLSSENMCNFGAVENFQAIGNP